MDLMQFVPIFGNFAFMIAAFVVALSVIVAIHEYGHYIVGRWCGIHAEVFSLGFGPVLFSRTDKRGTEWQIAALPLGGFVKFLGDANAASVGSDGSVAEVDMRRTMLGAPLWARVATVAAGPIFNFVLAIAIFAGSIMYEGRAVTPVTFGELRDLPPSYTTELEPGDVLIAIEGQLFDDPDREGMLIDLLPLEERLDYLVERNGVEVIAEGPFLMPTAVSSVVPRSAADDANIKVGDVITAVDGQEIFAFPQLQELVLAAEGAPLELTLWRDGDELTVTLQPRATDEPRPGGTFERVYRIGIAGQLFFDAQTEPIGLAEATQLGAQSLWNLLTTSLSALQHMIVGQISTCNLSGPVGIAETSGSMAEQGARSFIWFIGALSAAVGMINLFPIPVLDGGHLMFYAYEAVARRKPSEKAVQVFMFVGLTLILSLMTFTILNDTLLCP
ncbi:RIP metalloprotease RseP [Cognatiyoonia sp. IB215182]|uniref:RIP metalloprotease RseP n=1 Tax=Cognatiyoonia sp. IB215182 TaxID=3097353 RepID=UPI002A1445B8|nr:RIP metalloprotease RseP [Cognatiyoonia sp. IB215182]MDX8352031.1 RIP metalloprotease RseP [Cognatiyoonia sp. IB215182]